MGYQARRVLITGAAGNMGRKLAVHWRSRFELRLIDSRADVELPIHQADLAEWGTWVELFQGVDLVVHFAANPKAHCSWDELLRPNVDALIHVFHATVEARIPRLVFASSNHVLGGYQDDPHVLLTADLAPRPGLRYWMDGKPRHSAAYAATKLFGERLAKCLSESHGLETIVVRFGWLWRDGPNEPLNLPTDRGEWFRLMWMSDRDFLRLMDCCAEADLPEKFMIINGVSRNCQMQWDLEPGRRIGFEPVDDVSRWTQPWRPSSEGWRPE